VVSGFQLVVFDEEVRDNVVALGILLLSGVTGRP
jgi:hypothetical protein